MNKHIFEGSPEKPSNVVGFLRSYSCYFLSQILLEAQSTGQSAMIRTGSQVYKMTFTPEAYKYLLANSDRADLKLEGSFRVNPRYAVFDSPLTPPAPVIKRGSK